jgi:glutathione S-transferase
MKLNFLYSIVSLFTIYHFSTCPFSRTARICLKEKNQDFDLINESIWEHREEFLRINPAGKTPVLIIDNHIIIRGIKPLIEFIEEVCKESELIPGTPEIRAYIRYVFDWFNDKFYDEITKYILSEKIIRLTINAGSPDSSAIRAAKKNLLYHLDYLDYLLNDNTYLCGERITIADCAAAAQLSILDLVNDVPWDYSIKVKRWYSLMKSRPSLNAILSDEIYGITQPRHYSDPDF